MTDRCFVMLKPMRAGLSGYARIQAEAGGATAFISARGLPVRRVNVYWMGGGTARAVASAQVNPRGEAALEARLPEGIKAPERLQALFIIGEGEKGKPVPLLIGLCARQSAGSLMDAKNAMLALCERIGRTRMGRGEAEGDYGNAADSTGNAADRKSIVGAPVEADFISARNEAPEATHTAPQPPAYPTPQIPDKSPPHTDEPAPADPAAPSAGASCVRPLPFARAIRVKPRAIEPSREIFLPAIDPRPYIQAQEPTPAAASAGVNCVRPLPFVRKPTTRPADALPALKFPFEFATLSACFASRPPTDPLGIKGWRFVCLDDRRTVYVGRQALDGRVVRIAYAFRGDKPPDDDKPYRRLRGIDGDTYHTLVQRV